MRPIARQLQPELKTLLGEYPVVTILGPRQAGKTTLAKETLPDFEYRNLEAPDERLFAQEDPRGFLARLKGPVILDEIQRVPELLSYIQPRVDAERRNGRFVLTGSHQLSLHEALTQSLAGRSAILSLLPLSIAELTAAGITFDTFEDYVHRGFLPRVHSESQRPTPAYSNYFQTYVERDVRQLLALKDLALFEKFLKLLAGRVGQLVDYTSLGNDVGVDGKTIKHWLSILEASFIIFRLPPWFENSGKRLVKTPKIYFTEVGLLAFLLGLEEPKQISRDPLVGGLFENLVVCEVLKARTNRGRLPELFFFRDQKGHEVDLVFGRQGALTAVEMKSAATFTPALLEGLRKAGAKLGGVTRSALVYSGERVELSSGELALNFRTAGELA